MGSQPVKLLYIITVRFAQNGITSFVMNYYRHMDPNRVRADFVLLNDPPEEVRQEILSRGGMVYVLPMRNRQPLTYRRKLTALIKENGYEIVHVHGNSCTMAVELFAAKRGGARVRMPHSHNTACNQRLLHRLLRKPFDRACTHPMACGKEAGEWLFPGGNVQVTPNAIDTAAFAFDGALREKTRRALGIGEEVVYVHVGSFNAQKNHAFLLRVFSAILQRDGTARLLLIGDGPLMEETGRAAKTMGMEDRVIFAGAVDCAGRYLAAADVFMLPSLFEGLPFTLVEAQASGLACVVSDRVTRDAFFTDQIRALPLDAPIEVWADAAMEEAAKKGNRLAASVAARENIRKAGYDITDAAERLTSLYERALRVNRLTLVTHKMTGGGCERVIAQLLNRFVEVGMDCTLVTECNVPSFYQLDARIRVQTLLDSEHMGAWNVPRAYFRLRKLVKQNRPELVLAMPEKVNVWTVLFLLGTGVPVVVSERNDPRRHPENRLKRFMRRLIYPFSNGFIFQTKEAAAYFPPAIQKRGIVLPNPLDSARLPAPRYAGRERTVLGAGRLHNQKNFELLIRGFGRFHVGHPDWKLIIYGEGQERTALEQSAAALPQGAVTLPGQTEDLPEKLENCGIFVLSSDYEGMPNALIEAMATGAPCIATDCPVGGCGALIRDGENGLLIPTGDEEALLQALNRLSCQDEWVRNMGKQAATVRETLEIGRISEEWRRYLDSIAFK